MNTLLNHFRESWKEPHNGTGYISSINLKVDLSLNTKWILYQKSNENHAHCKCLRNTDHFRDGLVCAFELFALYLFIYLSSLLLKRKWLSITGKIWKKCCFIHWSFLPSQTIWHYFCIWFSLFTLFPGWLWLNPIAFFMLLSCSLYLPSSDVQIWVSY